MEPKGDLSVNDGSCYGNKNSQIHGNSSGCHHHASTAADQQHHTDSQNQYLAEKQAFLAVADDDPGDDLVKPEVERETWGNKIDFFLALVGFSVGLGNVWRFPYLCYKNGGGAFIIPYLTCVVVGGVPLLMLEITLGQFMSKGGVKAWAICPLMQGIGWATTVIIFFVNCYYEVILAWAFFYFFSSFTTVLPWDSCHNNWNTDQCYNNKKYFSGLLPGANGTLLNDSYHVTFQGQISVSSEHTSEDVGMVTEGREMTNSSDTNTRLSEALGMFNVTDIKFHNRTDPVTEFWEHRVLDISNGVEDLGSSLMGLSLMGVLHMILFPRRRVLDISDGIEDLGAIKWDLCLCLLLSWILVFFCICKGVKSSGKVVYFTATAPYALLLVLLIRGCTLPGAVDGILFFVVPDFSKLADIEVWVDAGTQVFFSYAIGIGGLTSLGSYNTWNHNSYRDSILFAVTNSGTSIFAGFVIFSVLGFMAHEIGVSVEQVAASGPGLAFVAYPKAVSQMPVAPVWSALFFFTIILLGLDSQFVGVEGLVTAIQDAFPVLRQNTTRKTCFVAVTVVVHFFVGLSMCTQGGMYVFQLFDYYPGSRIVVLVGFLECITVAWIYGVNRYYDNLEMMFGFRINECLKWCWLVLTPVYCMILFIMSVVNYSELTYERPQGAYSYPSWAVVLGWSLALIPIVFIALTALYKVIVYHHSNKPLRNLLQPEGLQPHQLRAQDLLPEKSSQAHYRHYVLTSGTAQI